MTAAPQRRSIWPTVHAFCAVVTAIAVYLAVTRLVAPQAASFLENRRQNLYGTLVGVHSTMLGFALATLTVVLGYAQSSRFQVLRDSPWFAALFNVFLAALRFLALALVVALVGLLFDRDTAPAPVLTGLTAGTTIAALLSIGHLLVTLEQVVLVVTTDVARAPGR